MAVAMTGPRPSKVIELAVSVDAMSDSVLRNSIRLRPGSRLVLVRQPKIMNTNLFDGSL